ncbi:hypothetical protein JCM10207_004357 [Rhodosporidiobolus poonsookiae]
MSFATEKPYVEEVMTETDLHISTIAFGWCMGFLCWNIATAWSQTHRLSAYTVMIWGELFVSGFFALLNWLFIIKVINHSFGFFFFLIWVFQTQFLLAIITNRVCLLWSNPRHQRMLKYGVAGLMLAINISVYIIWMPARLQINQHWVSLNKVWDRIEKCLYLVIDFVLNAIFIRSIQKRLLANGLERYRPLVRFNQGLVVVSLAMDALLIGVMSLPNSYLVKLQIEMNLGALIVDISTAKPGKAPLAIDGLKIAVSTHTTTTAMHMDEEMFPGDAEPERKTRTPARPGLQTRLDKVRRDRQARKEAAGNPADVRIHMGDSNRRGSDFSLEDDKIEMDEWQSARLHSFTALTPASTDSPATMQTTHTLPHSYTSNGANDGGVRFVIEDDDLKR